MPELRWRTRPLAIRRRTALLFFAVGSQVGGCTDILTIYPVPATGAFDAMAPREPRMNAILGKMQSNLPEIEARALIIEDGLVVTHSLAAEIEETRRCWHDRDLPRFGPIGLTLSGPIADAVTGATVWHLTALCGKTPTSRAR